MRRERVDASAKGWLAGPWDGELEVAIGFAGEGIDEPHIHHRITEIYLVARGTSTVKVEGKTLELEAGDVLIVEPGEAHTFLGSSEDYLHFVVHSPGLSGDEAQREKELVPRSRLGL